MNPISIGRKSVPSAIQETFFQIHIVYIYMNTHTHVCVCVCVCVCVFVFMVYTRFRRQMHLTSKDAYTLSPQPQLILRPPMLRTS